MANKHAETNEQQRTATQQEQKRTATQQEQQRGTAAQEREERNVARRETAPPAMPAAFGSPFSLMRRFMEDIELLAGLSPGETTWIPPVEVVERDGQLVVRAEVPGLSKDQLNVEFEDGQLVISGERRQEREERRGGAYRNERIYGTFYRSIPLPEGVDPEQAKAAFKNGVLEITMPAPESPRAKRIEIQEDRQQPEARSA